MSQTLAVELSDGVFAALQQQAAVSKTSAARLAADSLERQFGQHPSSRTEAEKQSARQRFERHFGEVDLGYATDVDNDAIDADLGREYANTHEEA